MQDRVRTLNDAPVRPGGRYVLYHMRVNRRVESNHALAYAVDLANRLDLSVLCREEPDDRFRSSSWPAWPRRRSGWRGWESATRLAAATRIRPRLS
jgi:hypothetical protein